MLGKAHLAVALLLIGPASAMAIDFGQFEDFSSGVGGWSEGAPSPNPPTVLSDGGPSGAGDAYLSNSSSGGFGLGSKQIIFNRDAWIGDYATAHVTRLEMKLANFGTTDLAMRVAFTGGFGQYASTNAVTLPAGSGWTSATFELSSDAMTRLNGDQTVEAALASVSEVRILAAAGGPAFNGDAIAATLGVDSIRALTRAGDATLDGSINFTDLVVLAQNYNTAGSGTWGKGDFNFDRNVSFTDLVLLAQNYNSSGAIVDGREGDAGGASFAADWALAQSLVPEPTALVGFAACGVAIRRRRRAAKF